MSETGDIPERSSEHRFAILLERAKATHLRDLELLRADLSKELEQYKFELNQKTEDKKQVHARALSVWNAIFTFAQQAIRTVVVVNGAGVTAVITLLGVADKVGDKARLDIPSLGVAAGAFAFGVALGLISSMFAYLSQYKLVSWIETQPMAPIRKRWERTVAVAAIWGGMICFLVGVATAVHGLSTATTITRGPVFVESSITMQQAM